MSECSSYGIPALTAEEYAKEAIESHRIDYGLENPSHEFVEALGCCRFLSYIPGLELFGVLDFCHVSFTAIPRDSDSSDQVVIFCELIDDGFLEFVTTNRWSVFKPDGPEVTFRCRFCPPEMNCPHPAGCNYVGAGCDYTPPDEASQQKLAEEFKILVKSKQNEEKPPRGQIHFNDTPPDPSIFSPKLSHDEYAELAISYINNEEGADFELVQTFGSSRQLLWIRDYRYWCHVCFTAKRKNDDADATPVRFFAELCDPGEKKFSLSTYSRVEPGGVGILKGCGLCPHEENYLHPDLGSFEAGDFSAIDIDEL